MAAKQRLVYIKRDKCIDIYTNLVKNWRNCVRQESSLENI